MELKITPKSTLKNRMFFDELKMYLLGKSKQEIAKLYNVSTVTICGRISETLHKLVNHFRFHEKNIDFPHAVNQRGGKKFKNAQEHSYFWLKVIEDYQKGLMYKYQLPELEKSPAYFFESVAKSNIRSEVYLHEDGVTVSSDTLPLCAFPLKSGKKYRICIQEITTEDELKNAPKKKYRLLKKQQNLN